MECDAAHKHERGSRLLRLRLMKILDRLDAVPIVWKQPEAEYGVHELIQICLENGTGV